MNRSTGSKTGIYVNKTQHGGLSDIKTHIILELNGWIQASEFDKKYSGMWIEKIDVKKVCSSD